MAKFLFIGGAASHSGKRWMTAAVCRHLKRRGLPVAPFKAQNMSLNSFPCAEGAEIGPAQAAQAEACGLAPSRDINPILLKPNSGRSSQVVLNGKAWRNLAARDYYGHFEFLLGEVMAALKRLSAEYETVVIEGAGSVSEINFRTVDLVKLGLARRVHAPALLVADIDRGGVFANICGTFDPLEDRERGLVRSFAINRFRGGRPLRAEGLGLLPVRTVLETETTTRVVGARTPSFIGDQPEGAPAARHKLAGYGRLADWFEANADLRLFKELHL